jgi:hypothetical protein
VADVLYVLGLRDVAGRFRGFVGAFLLVSNRVLGKK